jgi:predicted Zn-dependent protease
MFDLLKLACDKAAKAGCQFADARYLSTQQQRVISRDLALSNCNDSEDRGFGVRVLYRGWYPGEITDCRHRGRHPGDAFLVYPLDRRQNPGLYRYARDGSYRIEDGEVTHPVVDMRWNESVPRLLQNVTASGQPVGTGEFIEMAMPALKVENFHFTSLSN